MTLVKKVTLTYGDLAFRRIIMGLMPRHVVDAAYTYTLKPGATLRDYQNAYARMMEARKDAFLLRGYFSPGIKEARRFMDDSQNLREMERRWRRAHPDPDPVGGFFTRR